MVKHGVGARFLCRDRVTVMLRGTKVAFDSGN
jgi:hypothetical protein